MEEQASHGGDDERALSLLPRGLFILTAQYDGERTGARVTSVCQCATEPLLLCVAARKGHRVEPLIRDSHTFAVCLVAPSERLILRKFPEDCPGEEGADPFDSMGVTTLSSGSPIISRSLAAFDCEVVRHFDMEADHELYIGHLLKTWLSPEAETMLSGAVLDVSGSGEA